MKRIILAVAMVFSMSAISLAENNFLLNSRTILQSMDMDNAIAIEDVSLPNPAYAIAARSKSPVISPALDLSVKIPFAMIRQSMTEGEDVSLVDSSKPILKREGNHLILSNIKVNISGVGVKPIIFIKPWFESKNNLAIKFLKLDFDFGLGLKAGFPIFGKDEAMSYLANLVTERITESVNEAFIENEVPLKSEDVFIFSYDPEAWILRVSISPDFVAPLLPGLIDNISLTAFDFDDKNFIMGVNSGVAEIKQLKGYNMAISDGLITNFLVKNMEDPTIDFSSNVKNGGLQFRDDGQIELTGKAKVDALPFDPKVYFTVDIKPTLAAPNTIRFSIEKIKVNRIYGMNFMGSIIGVLERMIISSAVDDIVKNPELAKVMSVRKIDRKTVELKLEDKAFLPAFAKGAVINNLLVKHGLIYLGFEF